MRGCFWRWSSRLGVGVGIVGRLWLWHGVLLFGGAMWWMGEGRGDEALELGMMLFVYLGFLLFTLNIGF